MVEHTVSEVAVCGKACIVPTVDVIPSDFLVSQIRVLTFSSCFDVAVSGEQFVPNLVVCGDLKAHIGVIGLSGVLSLGWCLVCNGFSSYSQLWIKRRYKG